MSERHLALYGTVMFAVPLLVISLIAFLSVSSRLARGGFPKAARWGRIGASALALHAVGVVGVRYVADVVMPAASDLRTYVSLLPVINLLSTVALFVALIAPLVAMLADRAVLPNPSLERP